MQRGEGEGLCYLIIFQCLNMRKAKVGMGLRLVLNILIGGHYLRFLWLCSNHRSVSIRAE